MGILQGPECERTNIENYHINKAAAQAKELHCTLNGAISEANNYKNDLCVFVLLGSSVRKIDFIHCTFSCDLMKYISTHSLITFKNLSPLAGCDLPLCHVG